METKEMIEKYTKLIHLDIDAYHAYGQALEQIDDENVHHRLKEFQSDHERHVRTLSTEVRNLGEEPPEFKRDLKGFFISGFTAIRSVTGTTGALKAMRSNEKMTTSLYEDALDWGFPEDKRKIIEAHFSDEQRHLQYIENVLEAGV